MQERVDHWIRTYGVRYFNEMTNMAILTEEVGELARLMSRQYGEQSFKAGKEPEDIKHAISDELADIIFVITCLANQMNINLDVAMTNNLEKKIARDNQRHKTNKKL